MPSSSPNCMDVLESSGWWAQAQEMRKVADLARGANLYSSACFHYQQAAEMALKAGHELYNSERPGHDLADLLSALDAVRKSTAPRDVLDAAIELSSLYSATRYPDLHRGVAPAMIYKEPDAAAAGRRADTIMDFVRSLLGERKP